MVEVNTGTDEPSYGDPDGNMPLFNGLTADSPQTNHGYWTIGVTSNSRSVLEATWGGWDHATFGVSSLSDPTTRLSRLSGGTGVVANTGAMTAQRQYLGGGAFRAYDIGSDGLQTNLQNANSGSEVFGYILTIAAISTSPTPA